MLNAKEIHVFFGIKLVLDFTKMFTVLHFESFIPNLNEIMLPWGIQLEKFVWGRITGACSRIDSKIQGVWFTLNEMWKASDCPATCFMMYGESSLQTSVEMSFCRDVLQKTCNIFFFVSRSICLCFVFPLLYCP